MNFTLTTFAAYFYTDTMGLQPGAKLIFVNRRAISWSFHACLSAPVVYIRCREWSLGGRLAEKRKGEMRCPEHACTTFHLHYGVQTPRECRILRGFALLGVVGKIQMSLMTMYAVSEPIFGWLSDITGGWVKRSCGRRKPYLAVSAFLHAGE